jgi:hypothetical protein
MTFDERIRELEDQQGTPAENHLLYERVVAYAAAGTNPSVNQTFKTVLQSGQVGYRKPFASVSSVRAGSGWYTAL